MPEFPRQHSNRALTTEQPAPFVNDRTEDAKVVSGAIAGVEKVAAKWTAGVEKIQADTAMYNLRAGMMEIGNEAVLDTDIGSEAKYQKKIQDLRKKSIEGINNPKLIASMTPELDYMAQVGSIGIQTEFRKKVVIHGQSLVLGNLALITENPTADSSDQVKAVVDRAVVDGLYDEVAGTKLYTKSIDQLQENAFIQDTNADPAQAKKNLEANTYGFDVSEKDDAWKVYDREVQAIRNRTEEEVTTAIINKTMSPIDQVEQIKDLLKKGKVDANYAKSTINNLETVKIPKLSALSSIKERNLLTDKFAALKKKEWFYKEASFAERTQFRADVFNAHSSGALSTKQLEAYLGETSKKFFSDGEFVNALEAVIASSKIYQGEHGPAEAESQMTYNLMEKVMAGMNPNDALAEVKEEFQKSTNPNRANYNIGDIVPNPRTGKSYKVTGFDDDGEPLVDEVK